MKTEIKVRRIIDRLAMQLPEKMDFREENKFFRAVCRELSRQYNINVGCNANALQAVREEFCRFLEG